MLTPFDRLDGFERRIEAGGAAGALAGQQGQGPAAADPRSAPASGDALQQSIARVAHKVAAWRESRHTSRVLDHSELPTQERPARLEAGAVLRCAE